MKKQILKEINGKFFPVIEEVSNEELSKVIDDRDYKEKLIDKIREKYSIDDELAILRQKDVKKEEFNEYFNYVENCKKEIK